MPTIYEHKVNHLKASILDVLKNNKTVSDTAVGIIKAASPRTIVVTDSIPPTIQEIPAAAEMTLLTNALMATILELVTVSSSKGQSVMDFSVSDSGDTPKSLSLLIDAILWLATHCPTFDLSLPAACIELVVELVTDAECDAILSFLDSRLVDFKKPEIMHKSHHTILRTCILLLKRLSKSQDAALCGRVLLFLAKFLPLTERSGVNLSGTFHIENATPVDENIPKDALDAEGKPVDVEFYKTFWGLQQWFSNPPLALAPGQWSQVSQGIRTVLNKFASEKVTVTENSALASSKSAINSPAESIAGAASVKYLSSTRLLPLQLRDATFRRHFLLQALILMTWVENPLLKDWAEKGIKHEALEDVKSLRSRVFAALSTTPEKGREFVDAIHAVLDGEMAWATWKKAGCPREPLQVPALQVPSAVQDGSQPIGPDSSNKRPRVTSTTEATYGVHMGTEELDRLWNLTEDNLSTLGADDRGGFKTLRQLMEPVIEEMNEEPGTTDEAMKASKNSAYSWKTLRLVARDALGIFGDSVRAGGDLTVAARALYPDEVPPLPPHAAHEKDQGVDDEKSKEAEVVEGSDPTLHEGERNATTGCEEKVMEEVMEEVMDAIQASDHQEDKIIEEDNKEQVIAAQETEKEDHQLQQQQKE